MKRLIRRLLSPTLKEHVILAGPLRGCHMVTSWRDYPAGVTGQTERHLLDWFDREVGAGETWLDVGAHYGYTALALSRLVGPSGRVFAFEPVVETAGCVALTRRLNRLEQLRVVPLGLGSPAPEMLATVNLPTTRGMADRTLGGDHLKTASVQIARLDWLWPLISDGRETIHGVKIDVQGMELEVLGGMTTLVAGQRPKLVIEFHSDVDRRPILDLLSSVGYELPAEAVEPEREETRGRLLDDHSYAFRTATP